MLQANRSYHVPPSARRSLKFILRAMKAVEPDKIPSPDEKDVLVLKLRELLGTLHRELLKLELK
jgi:hypothetical protein